jgi:hypothetical protein
LRPVKCHLEPFVHEETMMTKPARLAATAALAFAAACTTAALPVGTLDVRAAMQQHINPAVMSIWDVTNNAMDDEGGIDPAQMDDARWRQVAEGAERLAASGREMAAASAFVAAAPGNTAVDEGEVSMAEVQRHIDGDPRLFRLMASAQASHADRLAAAARAQDAAATGELVAGLDSVCESCHARFWYPE